MFIGYNINSWQHIGFTEPLYKYKEKNQLWKNINKTLIASDYFTGNFFCFLFLQQRLLKENRIKEMDNKKKHGMSLVFNWLRQFLIHTQSKRQCRIHWESIFIKPSVKVSNKWVKMLENECARIVRLLKVYITATKRCFFISN